MVEATPTSVYTVSDVQALADSVKFRFMSTVVAATEEAMLYDLKLLDFLGKVTCLQFIPAAIDYWGDELISETTTGTNEVVTFPDRVRGLQEIYDILKAQVAADYPIVSTTYGFKIPTQRAPKVTYGDNGRGVLLTSDPWTFMEPEFAASKFAPFPWDLVVPGG